MRRTSTSARSAWVRLGLGLGLLGLGMVCAWGAFAQFNFIPGFPQLGAACVYWNQSTPPYRVQPTAPYQINSSC